MENAQKAIMIGVGLFITIIIIAAVMLITGMGQNLLNKGTDKAANIASQLDQTELEPYDNTKVIGSTVISVVKKYWNDPNIVIYVGTDCTTWSNADGLTEDGNYYKATSVKDYTSTHNRESLSNYTTSSGSKGITTSARYTAKLIRVNDNVVGVRFDKQ